MEQIKNTDIRFIKVTSEPELNKFIKVPWQIYKDNKNWVPPLLFDIRKNLNIKRNPFYKHSEIEMWLAENNGKPVGRIAGIINKNHNLLHNDKVGFFGYFECIDDNNVANGLFEKAVEFNKKNGMDIIRGPVNPSTNDEVGLLMDSYDSSPVLLMTYNPPYYKELIENSGFLKAKDLYAYFIDEAGVKKENGLPRLGRITQIVEKKENIKIRHLRLKDLNNELLKVREVYNAAWEKNWGFVPMTEDEFYYTSESLRLLVREDLVFFAEVNNKPVGFSLSLPDYNQVFKKLNGKLFPFGLFKFYANRKKIDTIRVLIMGIVPEYQRKGIDGVFVYHTIKNSIAAGYTKAEISWVLEDNLPMIQTAEKLGAKIYKTYRLYEKQI
jgi:GNAT superfamily N-acetyltransferase